MAALANVGAARRFALELRLEAVRLADRGSQGFGLIPRRHFMGGKTQMLGISKLGNRLV